MALILTAGSRRAFSFFLEVGVCKSFERLAQLRSWVIGGSGLRMRKCMSDRSTFCMHGSMQCAYIYIYTYTNKNTQASVCVCVCQCVQTCACRHHACMCTPACVHQYICTHVYMHVCTYACMHGCMYVLIYLYVCMDVGR